ncbi:hypothetical protein D3C76_1526430 [compost metagenome]
MQEEADFPLGLRGHRIQRILDQITEHGDQPRDLLFIWVIRHQAGIRKRQAKSQLSGAADLTQQKTGRHRRFHVALQRADVALPGIGGQQDVLFQFGIVLHMQ